SALSGKTAIRNRLPASWPGGAGMLGETNPGRTAQTGALSGNPEEDPLDQCAATSRVAGDPIITQTRRRLVPRTLASHRNSAVLTLAWLRRVRGFHPHPVL